MGNTCGTNGEQEGQIDFKGNCNFHIDHSQLIEPLKQKVVGTEEEGPSLARINLKNKIQVRYHQLSIEIVV
jgi:hypothetical protein